MNGALDMVLAILGAFILFSTVKSVVGTLVVPRGFASRRTTLVAAIVLGLYRLVAHRTRSYEARDRVLGWAGPTTILTMLSAWLLMFLVAYALMLMGISELPPQVAFREAGSSLFTLGFASTDRAQLAALDFLAAATGPIVIGLLIGYLPTLYSSYNRREQEVTILHIRAGEPNWAPEMLARYVLTSSLDRIPSLFRRWEAWAADVSESHVTYPILATFRSARPDRNWAVSLVCVLDAAALQLVLSPSLAHPRAVIRQGVACLADVCRAIGVKVPGTDGENIVEQYVLEPLGSSRSASPEEINLWLTFEEYMAGIARLQEVGFPIENDPVEAWPRFARVRVLYERAAYDLCRAIDAVPAVWTGPRNPPLEQIRPLPLQV
jgi:hypothetical protein